MRAMLSAALRILIPLTRRVETALGAAGTSRDVLMTLSGDVATAQERARARVMAAKRRVERVRAKETALAEMKAELAGRLARDGDRTRTIRPGARPGRR